MAVQHLVALAVLAPAWWLAGRAAQRLRLPLITGIMLAGVASGPQALGLLSADSLSALTTVDHICLSVIALAAGAELQLAELRKLRRQVTVLTLSISYCSWIAVFAVFTLLAPRLSFMASLHGHVATAVATLAATIAVARSPASAIAVLRELGAKGPYSSLVMAVVVVKDALVFVAFSMNVELARLASRSATTQLRWTQLLQPLLSLALAVVLGAAAGFLLTALLHRRPAQQQGVSGSASTSGSSDESRLVQWLRSTAPLVVSGGTFLAAETVGAEPLLACVAAGLVVSNRPHRWATSDSSSGQEAATAALAADLGRLMPAVNAIFFGLVGASLRLAAMRRTAWAALLLWAARLAGIWLGCASGVAAAGGVDPPAGQRLWMGMVTQAGIALGLAQIVARRFPDWGPELAALVAGVVLLNLAVGPPLFKAAVVAAGEARAQLQLPVSSSGRGAGAELQAASRVVKLIPIIDGMTIRASGGGLQGEW